MKRPILASLLLALLPAVAAAAPTQLTDSTAVESFRLDNGLQVRVRHVPGANSVAIALAYRAGSLSDPADRPGLAEALAQMQFTAPVGDVPERPISEMSSVRPLGWAVTTNPHLSVLTEAAATDKLPGLLHEVAARARGVQLDDSCLVHVVANVRRNASERRFGHLETALYDRVRDLAIGESEAQGLERAQGAGLAKLRRAEADSLLRRTFVASNAALALVGDFSGIDLRALVTREFGGMPAGTPQPDPPAEPFVASTRTSVMPGIGGPIVALGIHAPALEDSLHPAFFLNALMIGGWWNKQHQAAGSGLESHFQYALIDEPELVRFDYELDSASPDPSAILAEWNEGVETFASAAIGADVRNMFLGSVRWLVGGPFGREQRALANTTPALLANVASTTASRAIWKGDAFWDLYRRRMETARFGPTTFREWLRAPEHQALLVLTPHR